MAKKEAESATDAHGYPKSIAEKYSGCASCQLLATELKEAHEYADELAVECDELAEYE